MSHDPLASMIRTVMPSLKPHRSSLLGQPGCSVTLISAETVGIGSSIVVWADVDGTYITVMRSVK